MKKNLIIRVFILILGISLSPAYAHANGFLDYPHNENGCGYCHSGHHSQEPVFLPPWTNLPPSNIDETQYNNLCTSCHNEVGAATFVKTHSSVQAGNSYGEWSVECRTCHYPHRQPQFRAYGDATHLYSDTSTGIQINQPETGKSQLSDSKASWTVDEFAGLVLVADIYDTSWGIVGFGYKIENNTSTTITVEGVINLSKVVVGDTYAVIYGKLIKNTINLDDIITYIGQSSSVPDQYTLVEQNAGWQTDQFQGLKLIPNTAKSSLRYTISSNTSDTITVQDPMNLGKIVVGRNFKIAGTKTGSKTVRFFNSTGSNSFADGDTSEYDGICEVCHTMTNHHQNDGTAPGGQSHYDGQNCTECHFHVDGFK
ncbi:MAG: cytochrome c3 family protein [Nitrospirota bacterium]